MLNEKRQHPRINIDMPMFCTILLEDGYDFLCILKDISYGGAQLEVAPEDMQRLFQDQEITIMESPETMAHVVTEKKAIVVWTRGNHCGICFSNPLDRNISINSLLGVPD